MCTLTRVNKIYFSGQDLPIPMTQGAEMGPTGDGKGLIMAYRRGLYSFHCDTPSQCYWRTEEHELHLSKRLSVMIPAPSYVIENCDCELNTTGDCID